MNTFKAISQYASINRADPLNKGNISLNLFAPSALSVSVTKSSIIQNPKIIANPKNNPKKKVSFYEIKRFAPIFLSDFLPSFLR